MKQKIVNTVYKKVVDKGVKKAFPTQTGETLDLFEPPKVAEIP